MANDGIIKDILDGNVLSQLDNLNKKLLESLATITKLNQEAGNFKTFSQGNTIIKQRVEIDGEANIALKEKNRLLKAVALQEEKNRQATSKTSKELAKQRYETQQLNKDNKQNAILTSKYADAYTKLSTQLAIAKRNLKNLTVEQGLNSNATTKARIEVDKLAAKVKLADNVSGDFQRNVGNYPNKFAPAIAAVRQLVGAFGLVEGVRLAIDFTKESLALAREAKGVEFAFARLGEVGVKAFDDVKKASNGLLSNLDIKRSLVELNNFNINLEQAGTLFEFLTVRSLQTGQSIDKLKDSLVEGLSKESLLRIDNLGISTADLNDQLKLTPNFVDAVAIIAKREISKAGSIIDDATSSQERFNKSLTNTKQAFGELLAGQGFGFFGFLSNQLDKIEKSLISFRNALGFVQRGFDDLTRPIKQLLNDFPILNTAASKVIEVFTTLAKIFTEPSFTLFSFVIRNIGASLSGLGAAFVEVKNVAVDFIKTLGSFGDIDFSLNPIENFKKVKEFLVKSKNVLSEGGGDVAKAFAKGYLDALSFKESNDKAKVEIGELKKTIEEVGGSLLDLTPYIEKVTDVFEVEFNKSKNLLEAFKKVLDFTNSSNIKIDDKVFDNLAAKAKGLASEVDRTYSGMSDSAKTSAKEQSEIFSVLFSTFADVYGLDLTLFEKMLAKEEVALMDYADFAKSVTGAIFEGKFNSYEEEERKNREMLDGILNDKNASDKKKEQAQKEFDKKEKEINRKKAQATKDQALFDIAIAASVAFVKSLPNYAQAFAMLAIGAVQAGIVASKKIPEYYKGKNVMDKYEGPATVNELPGQREVRINKSGGIEVFKPGLQKTFVKRDDIIMPSFSSFNKAMSDPSSNVFQRVATKINGETKERTKMFATVNYIDPSGIEKAIARQMSKYANRPVIFNGSINNSPPRTRY